MALYGKVEQDHYGGELQLMQPQFEILGESSEEGDGGEQKAASSLEVGRIVPIYESAGQGRLTPAGFAASSTLCWRIFRRNSPTRFQPPCAAT